MEKLYDYNKKLKELDIITLSIALNDIDIGDSGFLKAVGEFREHLLSEINRMGEEILTKTISIIRNNP